VTDKEGMVRFKKVMEKPREILPGPELEKALEGLSERDRTEEK
jgi:hypothetical protein